MTLSAVTSNTTALATALNQYRLHLLGDASSTEAWLFRSSAGNNFIIVLSDNAGVRKVSFRDSDNNEVAYIDSNGGLSVTSMTITTFTFPTAASPTQTTEGQAAWDTDDNTIKVGDGATTKEFGYLGTTTPTDIGTADDGVSKETSRADHVHGGAPDTLARATFRAGRRPLGEYLGNLFQINTTDTNFAPNGGVGYSYTTTNGNMATVDGDEPSVTINGNNAGASHFFGSTDAGASINTTLVTKPSDNPRMLLRWLPGAGHANMTTIGAGFIQGTLTSTVDGAYLRANTTGNLFFVTREGGAETTTDLGARPTVLTSYEIYTEDAGVTWKCYNVTTSTEVASHTGNVPTASVNVGFGAGVIISAQIVAAILNLGYMRVDASY